jgi:hypothetical protein
MERVLIVTNDSKLILKEGKILILKIILKVL